RPGVPRGDRAVVHVVAEVRHHEADRRQGGVVGREVGEGAVHRAGQRGEVDPGVVLAGVPVAAATAAVPGRGQALRVPGEGQAGGRELAAEVGGTADVTRAAVVGDAVRRAGEHAEIVRLARMGQPVRVGQQGAPAGEQVQVRRLPGRDHLRVPVVLDHRDDDVAEAGYRR